MTKYLSFINTRHKVQAVKKTTYLQNSKQTKARASN